MWLIFYSSKDKEVLVLAKKLKSIDYPYISAYVRAKENKMLNSERAERMINAKSVKDAVKVLEECGYGDMSDVNASRLNEKISKKRADVMKDLAFLVPDKEILDIFRLKYDYHNAKVMIKSEAMKTDQTDLLSDAGRYSAEDFSREYYRENSALFSKILSDAMAEAKDTLARTSDPQLADFILDNAYYREFVHLAEETENDFLIGYGRLMIDSSNLRTAVRAIRMKKGPEFLKNTLANGGKVSVSSVINAISSKTPLSSVFTGQLKKAAEAGDEAVSGGSLTVFEKLCDDALNSYVRSARLVGFGPEVLMAYICGMENEFSAVRIIVTGKMANLADETIRERLRSF